jgi:hypothetical protein
MASLLNLCRFNPTAGGTTDWTYSSAVTGYQSPAAAGAVNGATYSYRAESTDLSQWEVGTGTYNSGTGVLARGTVRFNSLGTTAKINFSAPPQVAVVALAEDLQMIRTAKVQKFTASGTYTPSAGMVHCIIECVGGGGGGGGCAGTAAFTLGACGGSSAGYSRAFATAAMVGASQTVTIGTAGGGGSGANGGGNGTATSVGSLCVSNGGFGGGFVNSASATVGPAGANVGIGDFALPGRVGGNGQYISQGSSGTSIISCGGIGGDSFFGCGGQGAYAGGAAGQGGTATGYGAGGGGASSNVTANGQGGSGSPGLVIITEFCTQ